MKRNLFALLILGLQLASAADFAVSYARQLQAQREENWLARELRIYRAFPHLDRANRLIAAGQLSDARTELERTLIIDPQDLRTRLELAMLLHRTRNYREELRQCNLILTEKPGNVPALLYQGLALEALNRTAPAIGAFRTAAASSEIQPDDRTFALDNLADLYYRNGDYTRSLETLQQLARTRNTFDVHYRTAETLLAMKDKAGAQQAFRAARAVAKTPAEIFHASRGMADLAIAREDWRAADSGLTSLVKQSPRNPSYMAEKAEISYQSGDYQQADLWARLALKVGGLPAEQKLHMLRLVTEIARKIHDWPEVRQSLLDALESAPNDQGILRALAQGAWTHKDLAEAVKWGGTLAAASNLPADREFLANALIAEGRYRESIPLLEKLLAESNQPRLALSLASALEHAGRDAEAAAVYDAHPSPAFAFRAALIYDRLGQEDKEFDRLNTALAGGLGAVESRAASQMRGFILLRRGQLEPARQDLIAAAQSGKPGIELLTALAQFNLKLSNFGDAAQYARRAIALKDDTYLERVLAEAEVGSGHVDRALVIYRSLAAHGNDRPFQTEMFSTIGNLEAQRQHLDVAANAYTAAFTRGGSVDWKLLQQAVQAWDLAGNGQKAEQSANRFLSLANVPADQKAAMEEQLGYIEIKLANHKKAVEYLTAAQNHGRDSAALHADLGFTLMRLEQWEPALDQLKLAVAQEPASKTNYSIAIAYEKLGKPGLAIPYLKSALAREPGATGWKQLGYLYFAEKQYGPAADAWAQAIALQPDPEIAFPMARALRLAGRLDQAAAALARVPQSKTADYYDERAALETAQGHLEAAIADARRANELAPTAARAFDLGSLALKLKRTREAAGYLEAAYDADPQNIQYAEALAYAYLDLKRDAEAVRLFEQVVKQDPNAARVFADLGYAQMRLARNSQATESFKRAIDYARLPGSTGDTYPLRAEVSHLSDPLSLTIYQSYSAGTRGALSEGGVIPSQGGAVIAWTPPVIGLRDDRVFQVFARTLFSENPHSLAVDANSLEASAGVRYKPFAQENIDFSFERLFRAGDNALNAWLFQAEAAWARGTSLRPGERHWNYTMFYGDAARFFNRDSFNAFYGEAREGVSFNLGNRAVLTPHVVADFRLENPERYIGSYAEAGGGVSLRILAGESQYRIHRMEYEFLLQYKAGSFLHTPLGMTARSFDGLVLSGVARF
jgi:tetratricopeptide (TPR) repeat protein